MKGRGKLIGAVLMGFCMIFLTYLPAPATTKGGTLIYGQTGEPSNIDPIENGGDADEEVVRMVYENLVRFKEQSGSLDIEPALATRWEQSSDGLAWTFYLRKDINFHDGTPFNADAVVYYFKRALGDPKTIKGWSLFGELVKSVEAVDPYTVRIDMKRPHAYFLNRLAHGGAAIASVAAQEKFGKDMAYTAVGTGPFKFVEWVKGDHITLVANENYWRGRPNLDKIIIKPVREAGTRVLQLEAGQIQVTGQVPDETIPRLKKSKNTEVVTTLSNQGIRVTMNLSKKPFDNNLVRQALNYAVDKEVIAKHLYGGLAVPIPAAVSPAITGYAEMRGYHYNPALAKLLLAKAGYPNGFSATIWTTSTGIIMKDLSLCETLQKYFAAVGVQLKIERMEWAAISAGCKLPMEQNKSEMTLEKWPPSTGEATWMLQACLTKALWPPVGGTRSFYDNPVFEELLTKATSSADIKKRDAYLRAAQILLNEDTPFVYLVTPMLIWGKSTKLHDMVFSPLSLTFASEKTWLDK